MKSLFDEPVSPADRRTPAFEHVLRSRVMRGMGVVIKIVVVGVEPELLQVPAKNGIDGCRYGQACELLPLGCGKAHGVVEQMFEVIPVEILCFLNVHGSQ